MIASKKKTRESLDNNTAFVKNREMQKAIYNRSRLHSFIVIRKYDVVIKKYRKASH